MSVHDRASSTTPGGFRAPYDAHRAARGGLARTQPRGSKPAIPFGQIRPRPPSGDQNMGLVGRGGRIYSKFGIGQSLLMLPFDILGTGLSRWAPSAAGNAAKSALWNRILVVYSVSALVCVLAILAS